MKPVLTREECVPIDDILTKSLTALYPPGSKLEEITLSDKIGALIIMKIVAHIASANLDTKTRKMMAVMFAVIGSSTGIVPKPGESSVEWVEHAKRSLN